MELLVALELKDWTEHLELLDLPELLELPDLLEHPALLEHLAMMVNPDLLDLLEHLA